MADYHHLLRAHPEIRDYTRNRRWQRRGDVTAYAPNIAGECFSTDAYGFRRGRYAGVHHGTEVAFSGKPWAMMLGSSDVFGFGLPGDGDTIPSRVGSRLGLPVLNLSFPEADLRTLVAVMTRMATSAARPPSFVILAMSGSVTRYGYARICDPLFGSPDFERAPADAPAPGSAQEDAAFVALTEYLRHWSAQAATIARLVGTRLVISGGATAFTKIAPNGPGLNDTEHAAGLCQPPEGAEHRFAAQTLREPMVQRLGLQIARDLGVSIAPYTGADLTFIDEFHATADGCAFVGDRLAAVVSSDVKAQG